MVLAPGQWLVTRPKVVLEPIRSELVGEPDAILMQ